MKTLLVLLTLLTTQAQAKCTLELKIKKPNSSTFYLASGEKLSERIVIKLSDVCKLDIIVMSKKEITSLEIAKLQFRIDKLQKGGKR